MIEFHRIGITPRGGCLFQVVLCLFGVGFVLAGSKFAVEFLGGFSILQGHGVLGDGEEDVVVGCSGCIKSAVLLEGLVLLCLLSKGAVADTHLEEDGGFLGLRIDFQSGLVILYCLGELLGLLGLLAVVVVVVEELLLNICLPSVCGSNLECGLCLIDLTGAEEETAKEELCLTVLGNKLYALFEVCESGCGILCCKGFLGRCLVGEAKEVIYLCGLFLCAKLCAVCGCCG